MICRHVVVYLPMLHLDWDTTKVVHEHFVPVAV